MRHAEFLAERLALPIEIDTMIRFAPQGARPGSR